MTRLFYVKSSNLEKNAGYKQLMKLLPFVRLTRFLLSRWGQSVPVSSDDVQLGDGEVSVCLEE